MGVNEVFQILADELQCDGVECPLGEYFTLAAIWSDLARISNETLPADVSKLIDAPTPIRVVRLVPKLVYPCAGCGLTIEDEGGVCDLCAGFSEDELHLCEGCGNPGEYDGETCTALCQSCIEEAQEHARAVWELRA